MRVRQHHRVESLQRRHLRGVQERARLLVVTGVEAAVNQHLAVLGHQQVARAPHFAVAAQRGDAHELLAIDGVTENLATDALHEVLTLLCHLRLEDVIADFT